MFVKTKLTSAWMEGYLKLRHFKELSHSWQVSTCQLIYREKSGLMIALDAKRHLTLQEYIYIKLRKI